MIRLTCCAALRLLLKGEHYNIVTASSPAGVLRHCRSLKISIWS